MLAWFCPAWLVRLTWSRPPSSLSPNFSLSSKVGPSLSLSPHCQCTPADVVSTDLVSQLLTSMTDLLSSKHREVVKAAFGFIKVTIRVLPGADLSPHLEELIRGVLGWSADPKSHFRLKARIILERLCRKFG